MRIADHVTKARRIEKTMKRKLDRDADYEIFVETCMLAGTHWLNALLHKLAITAESSDLLHSDKPPLPGPIAAELQPVLRGNEADRGPAPGLPARNENLERGRREAVHGMLPARESLCAEGACLIK